jgi:integration host factor subunit alpha
MILSCFEVPKTRRNPKQPTFGNFELRDKRPGPGRNPKTGDDFPITARRVVTFKASHKMKESIEVAELPGSRE